ncbi:MAG: protein translocase subunit SecD, partial [Bacteroidetes bacterium]
MSQTALCGPTFFLFSYFHSHTFLMRNRNTVIFLLIVFVLICGYNLYWTVVQFNMDRQLDKVTDAYSNLQAQKPNPKDWAAADSAIQNDYNSLLGDAEFSERYKKSTERSFTLGLDLQGGMFVTLEVGIDEIIKQMASSPSDTSLNRAISCALEKQKQQSASFVPLFTQCYKELYPNASLGVLFSSEERNISAGTPDAEVERILASEAESAVDRTFNIIRTRIDQFGVVSPNLQKQQSTGRILLELPGVKDPERVRKLLRSTARLEFYTCQTWREGYPVLLEINKKLKNLNDLSGAPVVAVDDSTGDDSTAVAAVTPPDSSANAADDTTASATDIATSDTNQTPFDQLSPEEQEKERVKFRRENPLFALLQPANYDAFNQARSNTPLVGAALPKDTAEINKIFAREDVRALIPQKLRFAWEFKPSTEGSEAIGLIALFDDGSPAMGGEQVSIARQDFDPSNGKPVVSMRMTPEGSREWARITEQNVNKHVAILLDNLVYSYPVVNEAIRGGSSQISGDFTLDESKDLANILKAGQLPVPARIAGEETVGPSLGEENITSGIFSFVVSLILTLILVGLYYAKGGLVANVALILNLIFLLGCSAAFNIVLTLSGIAAVVLTIGMAVDANVLIFERIREELKEGKTLKASIKSGFQHALSSIIDSNVTTFLTALVLYIFGVGPIRGFAVSLMIGIITSLIAALVITRLILDYYANRGNNSLTFGFNWSTTLFDNIKVKMASRKRAFYIFSGTLTVLSFISFAVFGFKTGVDFDGGRQFVVEFR